MSDKKISQLLASTTPLAGTEELAIVQSGATKKVTVDNLTAGKTVSASELDVSQASEGLYATFNASTATRPMTIESFTVAGNNGAGHRFKAVSSSGMFQWSIGSTEHLRLANTGDVTAKTGNIVIGTSGKGIDFSATSDAAGMTSQLLNYYEEGTWTPTVGGNFGGDTGQVYATQIGYYTRVGNVVTCYFKVVFSTKGIMNGGGSGLNGFPFTSKSGSLAIIVSTENLVDGTIITKLTGGAGTGFNYFPFGPLNITDSSSFEGTVTYQIA